MSSISPRERQLKAQHERNQQEEANAKMMSAERREMVLSAMGETAVNAGGNRTTIPLLDLHDQLQVLLNANFGLRVVAEVFNLGTEAEDLRNPNAGARYSDLMQVIEGVE